MIVVYLTLDILCSMALFFIDLLIAVFGSNGRIRDIEGGWITVRTDRGYLISARPIPPPPEYNFEYAEMSHVDIDRWLSNHPYPSEMMRKIKQ